MRRSPATSFHNRFALTYRHHRHCRPILQSIEDWIRTALQRKITRPWVLSQTVGNVTFPVAVFSSKEQAIMSLKHLGFHHRESDDTYYRETQSLSLSKIPQEIDFLSNESLI